MRSHKKISPRVKRKVRLLKTAARGAAHFALLEKYKKRRRFLIATQSFAFAVVIFLSVVLQTYFQINPPSYALEPVIYGLVGESRDDTVQYLSEDLQRRSFEFAVPKSEEPEATSHTGRVSDAYSASMPKDASHGVSFTDTATDIEMTVVPKFKTYEGRRVEGDHIVYLAGGGTKLIYTLKYNGLKEDIIVPSYRGDNLAYTFDLSLPAGVEARLDEQGNIKIYSSDPTLFGEISFGSDQDRDRVEKARENGDKNHLVATIPSPVVKDASGMEYTDRAHFELGDKAQVQTEETIDQNLPAELKKRLQSKTARNIYGLTIASRGLKDLRYPISIDPTIQTTSAGDFTGLNNEGTEVDTTNNLIRRKSLIGGNVVNANATVGVAGVARYCEATVAYNGYLYITGGFNQSNSTSQNTTYYVPISQSPIAGNITTSFTAGPNLPNTNHCHQMVARDGYIYVLGGYRGAATGDIWRSKIRSDGSMSAWEVLSGIGSGHYSGDAEIIGDYVYIIGGGNGLMRYAQFLADGTIGTWSNTTAVYPGPATHGVQMASYNGVLYLTGGYNASGQGSFHNGVYYGRPDSTGNITSLTTSAAMPQAKGSHIMEELGGYLYVGGGCTGRGLLGECDAETGGLFYAQINTDGSLGAWRNNNTGIAAVVWSDSTAYNGIWYRVGGCNSANINIGQCDTAGNQDTGISYITPKPAGELSAGAWPGTNVLTSARAYFGTTVHNGYIYVSGGYDTAYANATNTVYYGTIATDGTVTWNTDADSTLPTLRVGHAMVAWNGNMYLIGGRNYDGTVLHNTVHYAPINSNGSLGAWSSAGTGFTTARHLHQSVAYNGYLYVVGGCSVADCGVTPNSRLNSVQYAKLAAGGALENSGSCTPWCTAANGFTAARDAFASHAYNGYLYILGGADDGGTGYQNDTQFAALNSDGSLVTDNPGCVGTATWCTSTSFTTARWGLGSGIHNGHMYVMGGQSSGSQLSDVQFTKIGNDGTLGTWASTQSFTTARTAHGVAIYGGYAYVFGGDSGGGVQNGVQYQLIQNGGSGNTGTWATTQSLPDARSHGAVAAANGYLYHVGGCSVQDCTTSSYTTTVYYTKILSDGTLTNPWSSGSVLTTARAFHNVIVSGNYIYAIGGETTSSGALNVEYSSLNASTGALGTWTTDSTDIVPSQRRAGGAVLHNGYIYSIAGYNPGGTITSDVYYALPQAGGGLAANAGCGSKWCSTTSLPTGLLHSDAVAVNGYLYVTGGRTTAGDTSQNLTYFAQFTDPGVGSWTTASSRFSTPKSRHLSFAQNGYLYVLGGRIDASHCNTIGEYAPLLPGGQIGQWQRTTSIATTRSVAVGAYSNGNVYIVGGQDCASDIATVDRAVIQTIPRISSFSKRFDFGAGVKPTKLITRGTKQGGAVVGVNYSNNISCSTALYDQPQAIANTGYTGSNAQTLTLGTSRTLAQCLFLRYTIDETGSAMFPDSGNQTTISDFDLYFTANPGQRLRGGRTFTNGVDRGLDAQ